MQYKDPTPEQLKLMKEYADICSNAIGILLKCEPNIALQHASARMQESMGWFNNYIMNGGKLSDEEIH